MSFNRMLEPCYNFFMLLKTLAYFQAAGYFMESCIVYSSEVAWQESPNTPTENRNYYQFFPKNPVDQQIAHMGSSELVVYDNERDI